jgi:hypothetical protein
MTILSVLALGQSDTLAAPPANGGDKSIPDAMRSFNNGDEEFGDAFRQPQWGQYPLNRRLNANESWANNMPLAFCRRMANQPDVDPRLMVVAKGGHPIQSFIRKETREARGWEIPEGKVNMAPYIFHPENGARRALAILGQSSFNVILWLHGQGNAGLTAAQYETRFMALRGDLIETGIAGPDTMIIAGGIYEGHGFHATHRAAMLSVCADCPDVRFAESTGLNALADEVHFTGSALVTMGQRMADQYLAATGQ